MEVVSVGFFPWSSKRGPFEPTKGRPVRLWSKKSTADKVVTDWGVFDPLVYGEVTVAEAFTLADGQSVTEVLQLLKDARWYVNDSLEAHRDDETDALLRRIDELLA